MKNYIQDFSQFQRISEATTSDDLLTKEGVAQKIMGTTPPEIAAANKKFKVGDEKGKMLGSPDRMKRTPSNDINIYFTKKPQLFDYEEDIKVSYNGMKLNQIQGMKEYKNKDGKTHVMSKFKYHPNGLPEAMTIYVIFKGSKMKTAMQSGGGGTGF